MMVRATLSVRETAAWINRLSYKALGSSVCTTENLPQTNNTSHFFFPFFLGGAGGVPATTPLSKEHHLGFQYHKP